MSVEGNILVSETIEEIEATMAILDSWEDKYAYIMELGDLLPEMSEGEKVEENLVRGCVSRVWMVTKREGDRVRFFLDSDALIVRGLLFIVKRLFDGRGADEIRGVDARMVFDRLGFADKLSPSRRNGLFSVVERVKEEVNEVA